MNFKIGDKIKCVAGRHAGYDGPIVKIRISGSSIRQAKITFKCSECQEEHIANFEDCKLLKPIHRGHHLTNIFKP